NGFGAVDFVMTQIQHEDYMSGFSDEQKDFFYGLPIWAVAGWAIGIWSAVIGSLLLLFRSRFAETAFLASLGGMAVSFSHNVSAGAAELMGGPGYLIFSGVIVAIGVGLYLYARWMHGKGVLA
ncbi:MAG: hypothetical protein MRY64_08490, partial [Hyphomonadaceae bacterium]|nr:hypothetical protein [Hyphomonadaceae bacterium]